MAALVSAAALRAPAWDEVRASRPELAARLHFAQRDTALGLGLAGRCFVYSASGSGDGFGRAGRRSAALVTDNTSLVTDNSAAGVDHDEAGGAAVACPENDGAAPLFGRRFMS